MANTLRGKNGQLVHKVAKEEQGIENIYHKDIIDLILLLFSGLVHQMRMAYFIDN